jgi:hypothetical protein
MDDPDITATRFLVAVMHDPTVDLKERMIAADLLCKMGLRYYRERMVSTSIRGGMQDVVLVDDPAIDMKVEGHA